MKKRRKPLSKQWVTISDAARYLGVSVDTLRRWERKRKLIPRRTVGGHRRYARSQLESILKKPLEQVIKTYQTTTQPLQRQRYTPKIPQIPIIQVPRRSKEKKYQHQITRFSKIIKDNSITIAIISTIILLVLASLLIISQSKLSQPKSPISPIPSYQYR